MSVRLSYLTVTPLILFDSVFSKTILSIYYFIVLASTKINAFAYIHAIIETKLLLMVQIITLTHTTQVFKKFSANGDMDTKTTMVKQSQTTKYVGYNPEVSILFHYI